MCAALLLAKKNTSLQSNPSEKTAWERNTDIVFCIAFRYECKNEKLAKSTRKCMRKMSGKARKDAALLEY